MSRRSKSYDALVAHRAANDPEFAAQLVLAARRDGDSVVGALRYALPKIGLQEVSKKTGIKVPNLSAFVRGKRKFNMSNLDKCLAVFGLELGVEKRADVKKRKKAA